MAGLFESSYLKSVVGGYSANDMFSLDVKDLSDAYSFVRAYGFDFNNRDHLERAWSFHRRGVSLIREHLLLEGEKIPEHLSDPAQLQDLAFLLLMASGRKGSDTDKLWSCAILKVMHSYAHLSADLFYEFSDSIQDQILTPFRKNITSDAMTGIHLGSKSQFDMLRLHKFETKPFKHTSSAVIKLLAKVERVAIQVYDKLGVRFVTKSIYDSFRVVRYLIREHIVSFPNIMPDQSTNTLYPLNLFLEVVNGVDPNESPETINSILIQKLENESHKAEYQDRKNNYSGDEFRFIKFISRQLVRVPFDDKEISFFFPFEVQIMDYETYISSFSGENAHKEYKKRQRDAVRKRIGLDLIFSKNKGENH